MPTLGFCERPRLRVRVRTEQSSGETFKAVPHSGAVRVLLEALSQIYIENPKKMGLYIHFEMLRFVQE